MKKYPVIIIGAGQAGLATSYYLTHAKIDHILLEEREVGSTWIHKRWDSFRLVTPNWMNQLPGAPPITEEPHAFLSKLDIIKYLKQYAESFKAPVKNNIKVTKVTPAEVGFKIKTNRGIFEAAHLVIATSIFNKPRIPKFSKNITSNIYQIHSEQYKNPFTLPEGGVLVVGSAQSGCQIAEDLLDSDQKVFLATSKAGRLPRQYRGKDISEWISKLGLMDKPPPSLSELQGRFPANACLSGTKGGHTINLRHLSRKGLNLLGSLRNCNDSILLFKDNLLGNLQFADEFFTPFKNSIDNYILEKNIDNLQAKEDDGDKKDIEDYNHIVSLSKLDLKEMDIGTIIWATGYHFDFSWIQTDTFDQFGYPIIDKGISITPRLYFVGLHGNYKNKSGLIFGVPEIAHHVANKIAEQIICDF